MEYGEKSNNMQRLTAFEQWCFSSRTAPTWWTNNSIFVNWSSFFLCVDERAVPVAEVHCRRRRVRTNINLKNQLESHKISRAHILPLKMDTGGQNILWMSQRGSKWKCWNSNENFLDTSSGVTSETGHFSSASIGFNADMDDMDLWCVTLLFFLLPVFWIRQLHKHVLKSSLKYFLLVFWIMLNCCSMLFFYP